MPTIRIERPKANFTPFPNSILENLKHFSPTEFKVLGYMVREQLGWDPVKSYKKPREFFSIRLICDEIKMANKTVIKAIDGLIKKATIIEDGKGERGVRRFVINWATPKINEEKESVKTTGVKNTPVPKSRKNKSTGVKNTPVVVNKIHQSSFNKKKTTKKTTTTSLPFSKIPKKLIDAFPSELQIKPILKITAEGLTGKGMPERKPEFILTEIEWLLKYIETHEVKNLTGLYRTALIEGYGNDAKLLPEVQKPGTQDPQKILNQNLAEQTKLEQQKQVCEAERERSDNLQRVIDDLPKDEYQRLKIIAIDSMKPWDRSRYVKTHSKFTLDRYMRDVYNKTYETVRA